ncbi:MAG: hypothetical protein LBU58_02815, partial [Clostridiales bacterium]|nr:hypothetical protein [Clostridiales bacterium]
AQGESTILPSQYQFFESVDGPNSGTIIREPQPPAPAERNAAESFVDAQESCVDMTGAAVFTADRAASTTPHAAFASEAAAHESTPPARESAAPIPAPAPVSTPSFAPAPAPSRLFPTARFIGQVFGTYLLLEQGDELIMIDQHAAHERVLFERFKAQYETRSVRRQVLLESVTVSLLPDEMLLVRDTEDFLRKAGFSFEDFGHDAIILREVPMYLEHADIRGFFLDVLEIIRRDVAKGKTLADASTMNEEALFDVACKAAVKGNHALGDREVTGLLRELENLPQPLTCPHGRPLVLSMPKREFEKRFRRI